MYIFITLVPSPLVQTGEDNLLPQQTDYLMEGTPGVCKQHKTQYVYYYFFDSLSLSSNRRGQLRTSTAN